MLHGRVLIFDMNDMNPSSNPSSPKGRAGCFVIILIVLAGGGWLWMHRPEAAAGGAAGGRGGSRSGTAAVTVAEVKQEDFEGACEDFQTIRKLGSDKSASYIMQNCK